MIVKNIGDNLTDMPTEFRKFAFGQDGQGKLPLTIDKKYVVSAVKRHDDEDFYLILDDDGELKGYPWWYPKSLFSIEDATEPSDWSESADRNSFVVRGFQEIVDDSEGTFYSSLEDGEQEAVGIFLKHYEKYAKDSGLWYADGRPGNTR